MFEGEKPMSTHAVSIEQTMETIPMAANHTSISNKQLWAGRILSGLPALFMLMDGGMKLYKPVVVVKATVQLGYPESAIVGTGLVLLASTVLYLIPRTAILGAILLTGYLGGAVATNVRAGTPLFNITFPVIVGALLWGGLWLRDRRLRELLPLRRQSPTF
jgi:DoxX-like family